MNTDRARFASRKVACAAVAVVASSCLLAGCGATPANNASADAAAANAASQATDGFVTEYTLYIGTNSQDGSDPVMSYADAKQLVIDLALKYVGGYTIYDAQGGWTDEEGTPESESTIVLVLVTDDDAAVHTIADEAARAFDQAAILIQSDRMASEYYAGK